MDLKGDKRLRFVLFWIVILFNMIFADIFSMIIQISGKDIMDIPMNISIAMGIAAVVTNIPIFMILLSGLLPYRANRISNIAVAIFTILYIIGGGVLEPHYILIASVEVVMLICIIVNALTWKPNQEYV